MRLTDKNKHVYCPAPFHEQMVDSDGTFKLCCSARHAIRNDDGTESNIAINTLAEVWNNKHMQEVRQNMIDGIKPANDMCENCYGDERQGTDSSRVNELDQYNDYVDTPIVEELPDYYDLRFGNWCNLQCIMCDPHYSSRLMTEQEKIFDLLQQEEFSNSILEHSYKESNLKWNRSDAQKYTWPADESIFDSIVDRMSKSKCRKVYVNGGEPTLHNKSLVKMLKVLVETGQAKNVELWLNTNATIVDIEFYKLLNNFKNIRLMLSIDGIEESFEYIRYPAKWAIVDSNIKKIVDIISNFKNTSKWRIEFQPTFQLLNLLDIGRMITYWADLKEKVDCHLVVNKLHDPNWYDICLANNNIKNKVINDLTKKFDKHTDNDIKDVISTITNTLSYKSHYGENDKNNLIASAIALHKIFKNTRNISHLDMWFYNTMENLK
jgi:uncharacterized Fe-S cluster-containing radical SAM superfamily protein